MNDKNRFIVRNWGGHTKPLISNYFSFTRFFFHFISCQLQFIYLHCLLSSALPDEKCNWKKKCKANYDDTSIARGHLNFSMYSEFVNWYCSWVHIVLCEIRIQKKLTIGFCSFIHLQTIGGSLIRFCTDYQHTIMTVGGAWRRHTFMPTSILNRRFSQQNSPIATIIDTYWPLPMRMAKWVNLEITSSHELGINLNFLFSSGSQIAVQNTNLRNDDDEHRPLDGDLCHNNAVFDLEWVPGQMQLVSASGKLFITSICGSLTYELIKNSIFHWNRRSYGQFVAIARFKIRACANVLWTQSIGEDCCIP